MDTLRKRASDARVGNSYFNRKRDSGERRKKPVFAFHVRSCRQIDAPADETLTAFVELERATHEFAVDLIV
jgi:hypothetical protein